MEHDINLDVATGASFKTKTWKNNKMRWSEISRKLCTEHRTNETYKEFLASTKEIQGGIKDVGGYVGGYLKGGKRSPQFVVHRQLITLDIDFAHLNLWDDFTMLYHNAAVLHGTHKHCDASPRYRLVMPLSRSVTPDEYVAISRKIAGLIGIDLFDNTTFETNRLMFWPSSSSDVEYYYESQDGPILDADEILNSYIDWTDISLWPTADKKLRDAYDLAKKQKDPLEKTGTIGAFCRTFTVTEVIDTYLTEEYVLAIDGRYTFLGGSTSGGLIIYDDKFAFSHHGTDPASNMLCNAFDLLRVHKFGHLDPKKSFSKMGEFALTIEEVKETIAAEKLSNAKYEFETELEIEDETGWMVDLVTDRNGKYLSSSQNVSLILRNDVRFKDAFKHNKFDNKSYVFSNLPWRKVSEPEPVKNVDYSGIRNYIESIYGIVGVMKIDDALALEMQRRAFHPVLEYLSDLEWDGEKRVDTLLIDYFGAIDNEYTRAAIRKMLVGAVARVYKPGIKFDLTLTLVGPQGTYKSAFVNKLGGKWYSDSFITVTGKEAMEQIHGVWIMEMAELSGLKKAEVESIKHFLSKQDDIFRPAYGRTSETYKRQCIFIGTTNKRDFLTDPTGNRRFMPVDVEIHKATKHVFVDLDGELDQIWAEAVHLFKAGETLFLDGEAAALGAETQNKHCETDDRKGIIERFLSKKLPKDWDDLNIVERQLYYSDPITGGSIEREATCVAEIMIELFGKKQDDITRFNSRQINDIMRNVAGWEYVTTTRKFVHYGKQRHYRKIDSDGQSVIT